MGRHHDRHAAVARPHHGVLEHADGVIELLVFLLHSEHEDHAHVGAGGEVAALVGDDDAAPGRRRVFREVHRVVQPLQDLPADGVHLGVEADVEDAVAEVVDRHATVLPDHLVLAEPREFDAALLAGHDLVGLRAGVVAERTPSVTV